MEQSGDRAGNPVEGGGLFRPGVETDKNPDGVVVAFFSTHVAAGVDIGYLPAPAEPGILVDVEFAAMNEPEAEPRLSARRTVPPSRGSME
jgi:hypothetical protein